MNDLERTLKDTLEEDASHAPLVEHAPTDLRSKVRRRQALTALVGTVTALAIVAVSIAGLRGLADMDRGSLPADDSELTATIQAFTITAPSDWYLVDRWDRSRIVTERLVEDRKEESERCLALPKASDRRDCQETVPRGVPGDGWLIPILSLSNVDPGLSDPTLNVSPCFQETEVARNEASMTIALDGIPLRPGSEESPPWPVPFGGETPKTYQIPSCGPGTYVAFTSQDIAYVAFFSFGDSVPDEDKDTLIRIFETMHLDESFDTWSIGEPVDPDLAPHYVIGGQDER